MKIKISNNGVETIHDIEAIVPDIYMHVQDFVSDQPGGIQGDVEYTFIAESQYGDEIE